MKFNKNISRILAYSLIFSMCNCCVVGGMEELKTSKDDQADPNTALVVYKPNPFLIENNQLVQNVNNPSCYICEAKDNPYINHVLGEDRKPLGNLSEEKFDCCYICGTSMHISCWDQFSKMIVDKYPDNTFKLHVADKLKTGELKLCPCCLYNLSKCNPEKKKEEEKTKTAKEKAEQKKEKDKDKGKDKEGITLTENKIVAGTIAIAVLFAISSNKGDTNITINNR